ncbi:hypothetical protein CONPUDRAFT_75436 [Coniophora puteana RWD-64-598 SS2]|uniref:Uncharacterized protein n=1 Tax=Coniophora puteana (strain RWD-64-598) TaxID=741705 RepID=A0A5M3MFN1_CONPW|nr:uncharacterized protein CONPUDRAFT_75436 [Coniophora puteana RWD-64-598 SS2]EIW77584.1 hypothetical protein CONPUDRAFT_75436 [Coniophora puteana RWD-64-598 SS2]
MAVVPLLDQELFDKWVDGEIGDDAILEALGMGQGTWTSMKAFIDQEIHGYLDVNAPLFQQDTNGVLSSVVRVWPWMADWEHQWPVTIMLRRLTSSFTALNRQRDDPPI